MGVSKEESTIFMRLSVAQQIALLKVALKREMSGARVEARDGMDRDCTETDMVLLNVLFVEIIVSSLGRGHKVLMRPESALYLFSAQVHVVRVCYVTHKCYVTQGSVEG